MPSTYPHHLDAKFPTTEPLRVHNFYQGWWGPVVRRQIFPGCWRHKSIQKNGLRCNRCLAVIIWEHRMRNLDINLSRHFIQSSASHVLNDKSSFESTDLEQWFSTFFLRHFKTDFRWAMSSWIEVVREFKGKLQLYTKVLRAEHKYDYFISTLKILHISTYLNVPPPSCLKISVFL